MQAAAWIVIAAADLNDYAVGAKVNAMRTAALAAGQADPFAAVMADVVATIRHKIASGGCPLSQTANAIPPELKGQVCWLIIEKLAARLGRSLAFSDDEKTLLQDAKKDIEAVMKGDFVVSPPTDPAETGASPQAGAWGGETKIAL